MTDEEIIKLSEKTRKEKFCPQYRECLYKHRDDIYDCSCRCPVSYVGEFDIQCGDTIYEQGFLDGFKAAYNILKIDVNKLTIGDVRCAIKQSPQYAESLLRSIGEEFRSIMIRNNKKHNDNN